MKSSLLVWVLFLAVALVSQNVVVRVMSARSSLQAVEDQKTYYPPGDPHHRHTPRTNCPTPPSHDGSYGTPPSHGGSYGTPPSHGGSYGTPPSHGGGGYYPPTITPPLTPVPPVTPTPTVPIDPPTPVTPVVPTPPFDPNIFPGTCDFWRTHPALIWGVLGYWGNLGNIFGIPTTSIFGGNPTLPQALGNTRTDGFGALLREGTAAFLNSMANHSFPFNTQQVRESFTTALTSEKTAGEQAERFRLANEGRHKKN